jgi:dihydroflavonol-4-reductase
MPKAVMPNFAARVLAVFDPSVRFILPDLGPVKRVSTKAARRTFGIDFRPAEEAVVAMGRRLIELNMV